MSVAIDRHSSHRASQQRERLADESFDNSRDRVNIIIQCSIQKRLYNNDQGHCAEVYPCLKP